MRLLRFYDEDNVLRAVSRDRVTESYAVGAGYQAALHLDGPGMAGLHYVNLNPEGERDVALAVFLNWIESDSPNPLVWDFPTKEPDAEADQG